MTLVWIIISALCFLGFMGIVLRAKDIKTENDKIYDRERIIRDVRASREDSK